MNDPYLLSILIFSPLLGMAVLAITPKTMESTLKRVGFLATLLPLVLAFIAYFGFSSGADALQFTIKLPWIEIGNADVAKTLTVDYALGVDGLSMLLLLLTTVIAPLAACASAKIRTEVKGYYMLFLLLEIGMLGVFASQSLLLFFTFFEMTLVPTYFLIAKWGYEERGKAANHFLIYNGLGSAVMLIAFIVLFVQTGTMNIAELQAMDFSQLDTSIHHASFRYGLLFAILVAFGVKLPIFPLHSWMVRVHGQAPIPTVMIHSGVLLKIGAYGLIRFAIGFFPDEFAAIADVVVILGLVNLLYGAFIAFVQTDFKLVLAYASISHMGIVLLGLGALNAAGMQGAVFQVISHGFISALLFLLVGIFYERTRTTEIRALGGLAKAMPRMSGFLLAGGLALLGLPGLSGFISEFMAFLGLFADRPILAVIGTLGIVLTAVYVLRAVLNITFGKTKGSRPTMVDLRWTEWAPATVLMGLIVLIGVFPGVLAHSLQAAINTILAGIGG